MRFSRPPRRQNRLVLRSKDFAERELACCWSKRSVVAESVCASDYSTTARMRRTPALTDSSLRILNFPSSLVCSTCGPPHNSLETGAGYLESMAYTLTCGGYFSFAK